jgi:hypothetical protein
MRRQAGGERRELGTRIALIHWNGEEAKERAERVKALGYHVIAPDLSARTPGPLRDLMADPPAALVIDLSRLPGHGRDVGIGFRHKKTTRHVPLVFVDGDPEKVTRIKTVLPDAAYTTWTRLRTTLAKAIAHPPENPVKPASILAGYSGTPLPKKLGIKPGSTVALVDAPAGFAKTLGALPDGARLIRDPSPDSARDLTLWFIRSGSELTSGVKQQRKAVADTPLWMIWPKKASGVVTDCSETMVRDVGLAAGLVDYKVCAVDATWSGLLFRRRKAK